MKIRKIIAKIMNTFVADCPVCHKHFYGFHKHQANIVLNNKNYRIVCHRCATKENVK